jgi:hypothetical protein
MANRINLFEVLREEEEDEEDGMRCMRLTKAENSNLITDAHMGAERDQSAQEQSMSSVHGNPTHCKSFPRGAAWPQWFTWLLLVHRLRSSCTQN